MNNIRNLRERKNLTLRELETKTQISFNTISKMERGEQAIGEDHARILADFFKVPLDILFKRDFEQPEKLVYKERDITYELVLSKLHTFSNQELVRIIGPLKVLYRQGRGSHLTGSTMSSRQSTLRKNHNHSENSTFQQHSFQIVKGPHFHHDKLFSQTRPGSREHTW